MFICSLTSNNKTVLQVLQQATFLKDSTTAQYYM